MKLRFILLISTPLIVYALVVMRLYDLQVANGGKYSSRAGSEYAKQQFLKANRGVIYFTDKENNLLPAATNKDFPLIYAVPTAIEDASEAANVLAPILNRPIEELKKIFSKENDSYEVLTRKADPELADKVSALKIKGIYVDDEPGRFYPLKGTASQVLGFVGPKNDVVGDVGKYGLEVYYDELLRGKHGEMVDGTAIRPTPGKELVLTIDSNIQMEAEKVLRNMIGQHSAKSGSIIVEDPKTGKILAMSSFPAFDPNNYGSSPVSMFLNPSIQQIYEPGSVFKVLTMAIGIDAGKITPQTTYVDKGRLKLNGYTIQNYDVKSHGPYGLTTMTNVIEHSINTGAVFAERQIGRDIFTKYLKNFGFGEKTGIDLPGELSGDIRQLNPKSRDVAFATASYGQGVAVTPIELITAMAAIANGGVMMRPYVNASLEPEVIRRVLGADAAKQATEMMISAVDKAGVAKINGYTIAGKTGSAFIPDFKHGGYTDTLIDSYVGFGPTSDPRFIVLIKLDGLDSSQLAALSVVPAFRDLASFILNYYGVEPDRL